MLSTRESKKVSGASRTYFLDIQTTKGNKPYLRITASRSKGKEQGFERQSIVVFPEDAQAFAQAVTEMAAKLG